jgi:hypothetical protein
MEAFLSLVDEPPAGGKESKQVEHSELVEIGRLAVHPGRLEGPQRQGIRQSPQGRLVLIFTSLKSQD